MNSSLDARAAGSLELSQHADTPISSTLLRVCVIIATTGMVEKALLLTVNIVTEKCTQRVSARTVILTNTIRPSDWVKNKPLKNNNFPRNKNNKEFFLKQKLK